MGLRPTWGLLLFIFSACSQVNLQRTPVKIPNVQSKGFFCTSLPDESNRFTKFLFVIDKSGSNDSTDRGAKKRATNTELFYSENKEKTFYQWGMVRFGGKTEATIHDGNKSVPVFTQDESKVLGGIQQIRSSDSGDTPYGEALGLTKNAIQNDIALHKNQDNIYMIFFLTDGEPTDIKENEIYSRVNEIASISKGRVFLSTAYYGPGNRDGEALLQEMARKGGGKYVNFNDTDKLDYNQLMVSADKESWRLKNLLVYNLNSAVCEDQRYGADSDGDGVCDKDELTYGLDPVKRSTPDDGYSDFFHMLEMTNRIGNLLPCPVQDRVDPDMDLLNNCEEKLLVNNTPIGTQNDRKSASPTDPDTDNDGILDGIELVIFRDCLGCALDRDNIFENYDFEPVDTFKQIIEHRNPMYPDFDAPKYDTDILLSQIKSNGQTCYDFSQTNLPLHVLAPVLDENVHPLMKRESNQNVVVIYFLQTRSKDPKGRGIFNYSHQNIVVDTARSTALGTNAGLKVRDGIFNKYKIPLE